MCSTNIPGDRAMFLKAYVRCLCFPIVEEAIQRSIFIIRPLEVASQLAGSQINGQRDCSLFLRSVNFHPQFST